MRTRQYLQANDSSRVDAPKVTSALEPRPFAPPLEPEAFASSSNNVEILKANLERASRGAYHAADVLPLPDANPQPIRIQAKLTIGAPGDKYEQEADRVAHQVVNQLHAPTELSNGAGNAAQRAEVPDEDELMMKSLGEPIQRADLPEDEDELMMKPQIQRKGELGGTEASEDIEQAISGQRGKGQALDDNIRQPMEQAFGADFSSVKVHTNGKSDRLNQSLQAKAFTTGQDVFFRQGAYQPNSRGGQELLAHELTHVVQQNGHSVQKKTVQKESVQTQADVIQREVTHLYEGFSSWEEVQAGAQAALGDLTTVCREIGGLYHGRINIPGLKGVERATSKVENEYDGDWNSLIDVARATVSFRNPVELFKAQQYLVKSKWCSGSEGTDWRVKNRYTAMPSNEGYRDIKFNFRASNKHVVELQLNLDAMLKAKKPGHALYDIAREETGATLSFTEDKKVKAVQRLQEAESILEKVGQNGVKAVVQRMRQEIDKSNQIVITTEFQENASLAMQTVYQQADKKIKKSRHTVVNPGASGWAASSQSAYNTPEFTG